MRFVLWAAAALLTFGAVAVPALADDAGTCHNSTGDAAIAACTRVIEQDSGGAAGYYYRGLEYGRKGEYDRAIADFSQAIRLDPKDEIAHGKRGDAYASKGAYDRAIADYSQAIRLDPQWVAAYHSRGEAYASKGEYDRAIADYDQAIRLSPKFAGAFGSRGRAYNSKGEYDRAIADFDEASKLDPNLPDSYSHRGFAYGKKGDFDRAMVDLDRAIALNSGFARGYSNRAAINELRGELDRAIADYSQALKLDPRLAEARQGLERTQATPASPPNPPKQVVTVVSPPAPPAVTAPVSPPVVPERRVALVIGNSDYRSVAFLPNPRRDAKAVADALRQTGFQVVELAMDLDRGGMVKALRKFRDQADAADWALVFFAGHGIEIDRVNYLIPTDAQLTDDRDVKVETVSYEELLSAVGGAKALRIVVLDACRVNPFKERMRRVASRSATDRGLAPPPESKPGTLIVYSAKDGEVAADDVDGVNSPFVRAFVAQLKVPGREVRRLFDFVRDEVLEATKDRQQPFTYGSLPGRRDFYFVPEQ